MNSIFQAAQIIPMSVTNLLSAAGGAIETSEFGKSKKKDTVFNVSCVFLQFLPGLVKGVVDTTMPLGVKIACFALVGGGSAAWILGDHHTKYGLSFGTKFAMAPTSFVFAYVALNYSSSPLNIVLGLANLAAGTVQLHSAYNRCMDWDGPAYRELPSQSVPSKKSV